MLKLKRVFVHSHSNKRKFQKNVTTTTEDHEPTASTTTFCLTATNVQPLLLKVRSSRLSQSLVYLSHPCVFGALCPVMWGVEPVKTHARVPGQVSTFTLRFTPTVPPIQTLQFTSHACERPNSTSRFKPMQDQ